MARLILPSPPAVYDVRDQRALRAALTRDKDAGGPLANVTTLETSGTYTPTGRVLMPMGEFSYFDLTGTAVDIVTVSDGSTNFVKSAPVTALSANAYEVDNGGANDGRLRYTGTVTKLFHVVASVSFSGGPNDTFVIAIAKNGTVAPASKTLRTMGAGGDVGSTMINALLSLATNDYVEVFFANTTDASDPTVHALSLFITGK